MSCVNPIKFAMLTKIALKQEAVNRLYFGLLPGIELFQHFQVLVVGPLNLQYGSEEIPLLPERANIPEANMNCFVA